MNAPVAVLAVIDGAGVYAPPAVALADNTPTGRGWTGSAAGHALQDAAAGREPQGVAEIEPR